MVEVEQPSGHVWRIPHRSPFTSWLRGVLVLLVLGLGATLARPAAADDKQQAAALERAGIKLFKTKHFAQAEACFRQAAVLDPSVWQYPWNVARSLEEAGDTAGALAAFGKALAHPGLSAKKRAEGQQRLAALEQLARSRVGSLELACLPVGATVVVTGPVGPPQQGRCPSQLAGLAPGSYGVEVQSPGYQTARLRVQVTGGKTATAPVELEANPLSVVAAPVAVAVPPPVSPTPAAAPLAAPFSSRPEASPAVARSAALQEGEPGLVASGSSAERSSQKAWGVVSVVVGGVAAGVSGFFFYQASVEGDELDRRQEVYLQQRDAALLADDRARVQSSFDAHRNNVIAGWSVAGVAALLAGLGVWRLATLPDETGAGGDVDSVGSRWSVGAAPVPAGGQLMLGGGF